MTVLRRGAQDDAVVGVVWADLPVVGVVIAAPD